MYGLWERHRMTDDERKALIADATALANWHCSDCDLVTSPYTLIEVRLADGPVHWLCWACLHRLFEERSGN
jgi:hypothetical protein